MDTITRTRLTVAANIKRLREETEISVVQAAKELGVGRQYWYLIESGGGNLPLDRLDKVAEILGVTVSDLLTEQRPSSSKGKRKELVGGKR